MSEISDQTNPIYTDLILPVNTCTIGTFDRWEDRIKNEYPNFKCDPGSGTNCTVHDAIIDYTVDGQVEFNNFTYTQEDLPPEYDLSVRDFKNYAQWTTNAHVLKVINNPERIPDIVDILWWPSAIPQDFILPNWGYSFYCDQQTTEGCFAVSYYDQNYIKKRQDFYRPARNVARNILFNEPLTANGTATLAEVRSAYAGFEEIGEFPEWANTPGNPQNGLLALLQDLDGDWYTFYTLDWLPSIMAASFINTYLQFLDYQRLIDQHSQLAGQNQQRSASIFEGSAVLLQLNAAKRTQLSPGLKAYLDRTIVEK
mgnify:CR=1 FL=1